MAELTTALMPVLRCITYDVHPENYISVAKMYLSGPENGDKNW